VQPAFQGKAVESYVPGMVEQADRLLREWQPGQERLVGEDLPRLTLQIICRALFDLDVTDSGLDLGPAMARVWEWLGNPLALLGAPSWLPLPGAWRFRRTVRELRRICSGILHRFRKRSSGKDLLLSRLIAGGPEGPLSDQEILDEILSFVIAGQETSAIVFSFVFYHLAMHSECDARVADEVEQVLGDRLPTVGDLSPSARDRKPVRASTSRCRRSP
jgi:cytochrome P450